MTTLLGLYPASVPAKTVPGAEALTDPEPKDTNEALLIELRRGRAEQHARDVVATKDAAPVRAEFDKAVVAGNAEAVRVYELLGPGAMAAEGLRAAFLEHVRQAREGMKTEGQRRAEGH